MPFSLSTLNGTPLQYSCLENPMDGGAWWAAVRGVAKSRTQLSDFTFTFHFHALEKEMATHSSVLAWRIPWMGEPGGLPSMGSHRVQHNWSDLAVSRGYTLKLIVTRIRSWNSYLWIRHFESRHRSLKQRILIKSPVLSADKSKFKSPPPPAMWLWAGWVTSIRLSLCEVETMITPCLTRGRFRSTTGRIYHRTWHLISTQSMLAAIINLL